VDRNLEQALERICQIITDATRFNSPGEKAASYKQCLVDAQACRDLMAQWEASAR